MSQDLNELFDFVTKFYNLWHSGKNARMFLECEAGEAIVNIRLNLGHSQPHQEAAPHHHFPPHPPRRAGPSRQRRRERRAQARELAAAADVARSTQPSNHSSLPAEKAVAIPATVQAVIAEPIEPNTADEAETADSTVTVLEQPPDHPHHHPQARAGEAPQDVHHANANPSPMGAQVTEAADQQPLAEETVTMHDVANLIKSISDKLDPFPDITFPDITTSWGRAVSSSRNDN